MGLRKGFRLIRGMRRALTEDEQYKVATCIAKLLESTNWKIEQGPAREGHGPTSCRGDRALRSTAGDPDRCAADRASRARLSRRLTGLRSTPHRRRRRSLLARADVAVDEPFRVQGEILIAIESPLEHLIGDVFRHVAIP